eukprot:scaffold127420_cov42-Phaeocystis_antarctica.AAC.1
MTRRVTLKVTDEIPARGEASLACSLGPGAFTRRTAYILCVCACLEGSLLFSDTSGTTSDQGFGAPDFTPKFTVGYLSPPGSCSTTTP